MSELCPDNNPAPKPVFFDTFSGQLLIGHPAYNAHIEAGGHPADIKYLAELLLHGLEPGTSYPPLTKQRAAQWESEEMVTHGRWIDNIVRAEPYNHRLVRKMLDTTYWLGLAPGGSEKIIQPGRFPSTADYMVQVGVEGSYQRGMYLEWRREDCLEYVKSQADAILAEGRKPKKDDFWDAARRGDGPSPFKLEELSGLSITQLLSRVGYYITTSWTVEDYTDWGIKFMLANNGKLPNTRRMELLSVQLRGPTDIGVREHFGNMPKYYEHLQYEYVNKLRRRREETFNLLLQHRQYIPAIVAMPPTPRSLVRAPQLVARYQILDKIPLLITAPEKAALAQLNNPLEVYSALHKTFERASLKDIKSLLREEPDFSVAWPYEDFLTHLQVAA